jgi:hypothetical protein
MNGKGICSNCLGLIEILTMLHLHGASLKTTRNISQDSLHPSTGKSCGGSHAEKDAKLSVQGHSLVLSSFCSSLHLWSITHAIFLFHSSIFV